jgi:mRNA interferase MazF
VVIGQGDIWWADMPEPEGSGPRLRRPVLIVQGDALNRSRIATVVCVPLTSNLKWAAAPGNALLTSRDTGLPRDSVANVSLIVALDRTLLTEHTGKLTQRKLQLVMSGIDVILGR